MYWYFEINSFEYRTYFYSRLRNEHEDEYTLTLLAAKPETIIVLIG